MLAPGSQDQLDIRPVRPDNLLFARLKTFAATVATPFRVNASARMAPALWEKFSIRKLPAPSCARKKQSRAGWP